MESIKQILENAKKIYLNNPGVGMMRNPRTGCYCVSGALGSATGLSDEELDYPFGWINNDVKSGILSKHPAFQAFVEAIGEGNSMGPVTLGVRHDREFNIHGPSWAHDIFDRAIAAQD